MRSGWLLLSTTLLALGCSSDPADPEAAGGSSSDGSSGTAGKGGSTAGGRAPEACPLGPGEETESASLDVGIVTGQIVDENGDPTSSGLVQVCGKNVCINADVLDDGKLDQAVNQGMLAPACKIGNGKEWGKLAFPIGAGDSELGTLTTVRLPAFEDGAPLEAGKAATSGEVTLTLAADARVEVDELTYEEESQHGFRAVKLPEASLALLDNDFAVAYALSPVETRICPSPALSIENSSDLPASATLELFILGLDVLEIWAPYAGWQKVGEGQVSDDGATLEFPDGLPLLTAIGIREKP
jgi:hypothetical protein